jgi:uncharacterized membrane protein (DUF106 family)
MAFDIVSIIQANPKVSIVVISFLITFLSTLVYKYTTNQNRMKELKEVQKACQIKFKDARSKNDTKKMMDIQKQITECSLEMMKYSFKPMFLTMIPFLLLFVWLGKVYGGTTLGKSWFWWYLVSGILFNIAIRRAMKLA